MAAGGVEAAAVRARCVKTLGRSVACCSPGRRVHSTATMVTEVESMDQFKKELKDAGDKLVVVDFTASWCGPCKMISPYYKQLSESAEFSDVVFLLVDVDEAARDVAQSCGISAMPTFQFYKNGNMVDHFTGASQDKLLQFLRRLK
ncbi:Thioredoxin isoform 2 [Scophthalmus maximus]|uniref:Thioredoxin isoform 2 n=1 Tax=Scophthalmus maximus TaxID=52904 RepID=A0A2U9B0N9_SCOMX|nr:Thioredoxin isoform 2 [Scophthalmus maximus]